MNNFRATYILIFISIMLSSIGACSQAAPTTIPTIAATATTVPTVTPAPAIEPGDFTRKLMANGEERSYLLHIPAGLKRDQPVPVLFAFHGWGDVPKDMQAVTGFNDIADKAGFLVVYPRAIGGVWNVECCGIVLAKNVDEQAFIRQILTDLETLVRVDSKRVYVTGVSLGATLVYQLGCQMSDIFAGIAPVAGALAYSPCQPQDPVSLIHLHGLADNVLPYEGGGQFNIRPIEEIIATWAKLDGCTDSPKVDTLKKIIKRTAYSSCKAGTAVELYAIQFSGHAWQSFTGWSGSQAIWDFFAAHPKP